MRPRPPAAPAQALGGLKVLLNIVSFSSSTSPRSRALSCKPGGAAGQQRVRASRVLGSGRAWHGVVQLRVHSGSGW